MAGDEGKKMATQQLNPDWVEWLMGFPRGWTNLEPLDALLWTDWEVDPANTGECPRVATGTPNRVGRLKALGNAQVPGVARLAWELLTGADVDFH